MNRIENAKRISIIFTDEIMDDLENVREHWQSKNHGFQISISDLIRFGVIDYIERYKKEEGI